MHHTWIEISRSALFHNITHLATLLSPAKLAAVVKGNAYGHGFLEVSTLLAEHPGVAWLCVGGVEEGVMLRAAGITKPILTLAYPPENYHDVLNNNLEVTVWNEHIVRELNQAAHNLHITAHVHVKVDTGMTRLGILPEELVPFLVMLQGKYKHIMVTGILTHLSDKDNPDNLFVRQQLHLFDKLMQDVKDADFSIPIVHALSSGSLDYASEKKYTLARAGTNMYGFWSSPESRERACQKYSAMQLKPVLTWKTKIIHIKKIAAGSSVGYGRTFIAPHPMTIAVLPVGYCDGYSRALSNKGRVMVHNKIAPVIGIVSMNLTIIDVTHIDHVTLGDTVTLLGAEQAISADTIAHQLGTINIEVTTKINPTIKRIIVD